MKISDLILLSFTSIRTNKLRAAITIAIIALGIMALIGIITAIQAMNQKMTESFSTMGADGFSIRFKERSFNFGSDRKSTELSNKRARKEKKSNLDKPISQNEAENFKKYFSFNSSVSISTSAGNRNSVGYQKIKTNPTIMLFGADENYLVLNGFALANGRNLSMSEVVNASDVCILGYDVAAKLFSGSPLSAIHNLVRINGKFFRVISVLESRGSTFGFSRDNIIIIPYKNLSRNFSGRSYTIGIKTNDIKQVDNAMGEAEGLFRSIRKLNTIEENNFIVDRSNTIAEKAMNSLRLLTLSTIIIGFITLIGAAIGLMNIMLVSVSERTREVGLLKAIGAKKKIIRYHFLIEAILYSIFGSVVGIVLGVLIGNLFAVLLQTGFVIPWNWVIYGIEICTLIGLVAGLYPAIKAGKLNPIEALRYE